MELVSHRGINLSNKIQLQESSIEAFGRQLAKGFGIEFDINFTKDKEIIIFHDDDLFRISKGEDKRKIKNLNLKDLKKLKYVDFCTLEEVFDLLEKYPKRISAMHLKGDFQTKKHLDTLIKEIKKNTSLLSNFIIFDLKISTAKYLKNVFRGISLAPSVAHEYDIKRFNSLTKKTLYSPAQAINNKNIFNWVWLDEWDRKAEKQKKKTLLNKKIFSLLKENSFKIALVTPELHGDIHVDANNKKRLLEIKELKPDMVCTDMPSYIKKL